MYEAPVGHFSDYALAFMARGDRPGLPGANRPVMAQFMVHGFAGAIRAWLNDPSATKNDWVDASVACAPAWWAADANS
ncbi:hypothetical protein [Streptomyces lydicus]|uniref:hypothetical protein n=1 Tax=Streptomyces lydicus TaxID=47763 RepID=UPI0019D6B2C8|nr:hypothetical protein [Streptomyces lydicus]MCZ1011492.1 hypothetical protein [Streptomyces lydicus]